MSDPLQRVDAMMAEVRAAARAKIPERVAALDEQVRIEVVAWAYGALLANIHDGGSFRKLIYDRLGFSGGAYKPLHEAGAMILNEMEYPTDDTPRQSGRILGEF